MVSNYQSQNRFAWTAYYMELADKLLLYKNNREQLLKWLDDIYKALKLPNPLVEKDGTPLDDVCPFTVFSCFNKKIKEENRINLLKRIGHELGVEAEAPTTFDGIPVFPPLKTWFFRNKDRRDKDDILHLWELFEAAVTYADKPTESSKERFIEWYDKVREQKGIYWNLSIGLYWIRPFTYLNLDERNRNYLMQKEPYSEKITKITDLKLPPSAKDYLKLISACKEIFADPNSPHKSFPELSLAAWESTIDTATANQKRDDDDSVMIEEQEDVYESYTEDDFLKEVFMDAERYHTLVNLLKYKKNIILQGAPGVGKTFVAKRLAFSIMGQKDTSRIQMVQFHQSYSYEDFIEGYRPSKDSFELKSGPFYDFCQKAKNDPDRYYFFIIDEINRGNVSKIFGELMMLIERDKRGEALRLLYSDEDFSVPKNVYIIGTMNTADRSLAIIDYALRRRFAFFELEPAFDSKGFREYMNQANNPKLNKLVETIKDLNNEISNDESLGSGFRIGHSYLCTDGEVTDEWLECVVNYELLPLLEEYWFDQPEKVERWKGKLGEALK